MIRANGHNWNNFFCRRVYSCSRFKGQSDNSFEMENTGWGKHLFGSSESQRLHHCLSPKDDREVGGEGCGGEFSDPQAVSFNGALFKRRILLGATSGRINLSDKLLEHAGIKERQFLWESFPLLQFGRRLGVSWKVRMQVKGIFLMR